MKISIFVFLLLFSVSGFSASIESININSEGVDLLIDAIERHEEAQKQAKQEAPKGQPPEKIKINPDDFNPAFEKFITAIGNEPTVGQYRFNLALVLQLQGKLQQALKEYEFLLKAAQNNSFKFDVLFNTAILRTQANEIGLALSSYQKALEIKPDNKDVKTNIELLWQQQQGKGEGEGKDKDQKDSKDKDKGKGEGDDKDKNKDPNPKGDSDEEERKKNKKKPRPLSQKEIKRILEELKNQEQKIRAKDLKGKRKERPRDKDW